MIAYMDSGFKNSHLSTTDCILNKVDAQKKQIYPHEWLRGNYPDPKKNHPPKL